MQSYLLYLLADIAEACREEQPASKSPVHKSMEEYFEEVERWLENEPQHSFSYYCGLNKEQFPPAGLLTEVQMEELCKSFNALLYTWNLSVDDYLHIPIAKRYTLLVSVLDEKLEIPDSGILTIEFCNTYPPTCPLNEYCTCRETWDRDESFDDTADGDSEIPF